MCTSSLFSIDLPMSIFWKHQKQNVNSSVWPYFKQKHQLTLIIMIWPAKFPKIQEIYCKIENAWFIWFLPLITDWSSLTVPNVAVVIESSTLPYIKTPLTFDHWKKVWVLGLSSTRDGSTTSRSGKRRTPQTKAHRPDDSFVFTHAVKIFIS